MIVLDNLRAGVTLYVTPISIMARRKLAEKAAELHPLPDEAAYHKPLPNSAIPGQTFFDKDDPEYRRLALAAMQKQMDYITIQMVNLCVNAPDKDKVISRYAKYVNEQTALFGSLGNEWLDTLLYGVLVWDEDYNTVKEAIMNKLPLEEAELADGLKIFRVSVSG